MLNLSLPIEANPAKAVTRAINRALSEKPIIEATAKGTFLVTSKSKNTLYHLTLSLNKANSQISATCDCPAHTGVDMVIDQSGNPHTFTPENYKPLLCKHIVAVLLSLTYQGELHLAKARCYRCGNPETHYYYLVSRYECLKCSEEDLFGKEDGSSVPVCEECRENSATVEGVLCSSCFDFMRYSDYAGASKF